jgi:hypothetical protein
MSSPRKGLPIRDDGWVTLQAAADALGVTRTKALALIVKGDLVGKHIAGRTVVRRDSVDAVREATAA